MGNDYSDRGATPLASTSLRFKEVGVGIRKLYVETWVSGNV